MADRLAINLMVLDDEPLMLKLLEQMLMKLGHNRISCFNDGLAALEKLDLRDVIPDVILLDINMPGMDGIEFVRHLSERHFSGCLILVSGEDVRMLQSIEKLAQAYHLSVLGSLSKPPSRTALADLINQWSPHLSSSPSLPCRTYDGEDLRNAIANGELINYYQPKVAVATGEMVAVETLVRWQHPEDGLVFPDRFIPVAEAHGLIGEVTRTVLKGALKQIKDWQEMGLSLHVAVNISMDDLTEVEFADFVIKETQAAGIMPQSVILEVTESRLMRNYASALDVLSRLCLKRFRLSIDDFGTGHSSLAQLRDLPFDELKIDRSFTHGAWKEARLQAISEGSRQLAGQLGMDVVMEGVEDADDWNYLSIIGCQLAQGYYIARPMPAEALLGWLDTWSKNIEQGAIKIKQHRS